MNAPRRIVLVALLAASALSIASAQQESRPAAGKPAAAPVAAAPPAVNRGERAFNQNCSRCHQPPESLNPRVTGTILRHMRVRANLSAQDEQDILRFLNP